MACAQGASNTDVAAALGVHLSTVGKWRRRFLKLRLDGLIDEDRPGCPPSITLDQVEEVVVATLEQMPRNATRWSRQLMAERSGLSKSTIGRSTGSSWPPLPHHTGMVNAVAVLAARDAQRFAVSP